MKTINTTEFVTVPEGVTLTLDRRTVTVKGPRGELKRSFRHLQLELTMVSETRLRIDSWFAKRKDLACIRTICSHIENMMKGVKYGYAYKLKAVYAHFPINMTFTGKTAVQVRNFLGEKVVREVSMIDGVTVRATGEKDEIVVEGNDIEKVSLSAALIHQCALVKRKDIRKFLDGVYVSEKGTVDPIED
eukprot:TRINITY_DN2896_c0_g1_i5.p2 TRINITY_DN2896_c0_g1~~TRINITY_DN2896_c0_g1_i5.p2  ORF type:complete len:198 (+),score=40.42 TRINITY_DN2896_c0_g1_i5:29-595(+)